jgi:hypothetical protein
MTNICQLDGSAVCSPNRIVRIGFVKLGGARQETRALSSPLKSFDAPLVPGCNLDEIADKIRVPTENPVVFLYGLGKALHVRGQQLQTFR